MPPTVKTPMMARTASISIMLLPDWEDIPDGIAHRRDERTQGCAPAVKATPCDPFPNLFFPKMLPNTDIVSSSINTRIGNIIPSPSPPLSSTFCRKKEVLLPLHKKTPLARRSHPLLIFISHDALFFTIPFALLLRFALIGMGFPDRNT